MFVLKMDWWHSKMGAYFLLRWSKRFSIKPQTSDWISQDLRTELGEENIQRFLNFVLHYVADLKIPVKRFETLRIHPHPHSLPRGTFVEFRSGMINISPIGRNCSKAERDDFEKYDNVTQSRDLQHLLCSYFVCKRRNTTFAGRWLNVCNASSLTWIWRWALAAKLASTCFP